MLTPIATGNSRYNGLMCTPFACQQHHHRHEYERQSRKSSHSYGVFIWLLLPHLIWPNLQWRRNREFRQFNEPGPRAPGGARDRSQKNLSKKRIRHFWCHLSSWEHKKHQNPWLTPLLRPGIAGPRAPKPHLRSQHFGLPILALGGRPRELRAPRLLLNQGR